MLIGAWILAGCSPTATSNASGGSNPRSIASGTPRPFNAQTGQQPASPPYGAQQNETNRR